MTSAAQELPMRIDEMDAQWLGDALQRSFDGPPPRVTRRDATLDGTATKVRVHLEGAGEAWPATVMVKGGFAAHRELMAPIYAKEVRAYRDILPRVAIETPRCWFAADDPAPRQHLLVLEDLIAARMSEHGVADVPGFDACWDAYRRQAIDGLYFWMVNPVAFQAEVNNCAVAPRFAMAALELESFELLLVE